MKNSSETSNYSRFLEEAKNKKSELEQVRNNNLEYTRMMKQFISSVNFLETCLTTPGFEPEDPGQLEQDREELERLKEIEAQVMESYRIRLKKEESIEQEINTLKGAHLRAAKLLKKYEPKTIH